MPRIRLLAALAAALLAALVWYFAARPVAVAERWVGSLASASFAPFRDGQSPLTRHYPDPAQIEDDLVRLKGVFRGIRTYTAREGMDVVPELAARHGFALTHSAWLGRDPAINAAELQALIDAANRYPQAIERVIVGNEVLLRRDLPVETLIAALDQVRAAVRQPVSYADVWAFWLKNPQLAEHVDFITIHILPYWEDEPAAVADAETHTLEILARIRAAFPGKPILIGEIGWPSEGRNRGPATASLPEAARFVRALPGLAAAHGFDYNVVEAYDQPWKAQLEGTVGARWGLFDIDRVQKFTAAGPVEPFAHASARALGALALGLLLALPVLPAARSGAAAVVAAIACQVLAAGAVEAAYGAWRLVVAPTSLTWGAQKLLFLGADLGWLAPDTVGRAYRALADSAAPLARGWAWVRGLGVLLAVALTVACLRDALAGRASGRYDGHARVGYALYCVGALGFSALFAYAGRYLDIATPDLLPALLGALALAAVRRSAQGRPWREALVLDPLRRRPARWLPWLLVLAAVAVLAGEGWALAHGEDFVQAHPGLGERLPLIAAYLVANRELLGWVATLLALALPLWAERRLVRPA